MNDDDVACRGARFDECGGDERLHPISTITKAVGRTLTLWMLSAVEGQAFGELAGLAGANTAEKRPESLSQNTTLIFFKKFNIKML